MRGLWVLFLVLSAFSQLAWDQWQRHEVPENKPRVISDPPGARIYAHILTIQGSQRLPVGRSGQALQLPRQGLQWLELEAPGYLPKTLPKGDLNRERIPPQGAIALTPRWFFVPWLMAPGYWIAALGALVLLATGHRQARLQRLLDRSFEQGKALPGQEIGPYVVDSTLGSGGMARVYQVHLKADAREVRALKLLHAPGGGERFYREAKISLALRHPHLVAFYDYGEHQGRAYLVMEKVEGCTLDRAKLDLSGRLRCLSQVCQALQVLHDQGIVHRDLKPSNIMLTGSKALLMDFGIARSVHEQGLTLEGQAVGTPGYMAPEQILGEDPHWRADLYSLGVVLYECCSGGLPYQAETSFELLTKQLEQTPRPLEGQPPELCRLVMGLLERDPARRPGPAGELARQLESWSRQPEVYTAGSDPATPDR